MTNEIHEFTPTERIKQPSYSLMATWVRNAWDGVDINLIKSLFSCCGISSGQDFNIDQQYEMENEDYVELENNIELIDLTNEETVWVEMEDIDNIYSEEPMVEND
ncbi:6804_t:CDS:1 [Dentiscutata erythropus]|uniref:6804_t:CDS:1 n=1 Tax=Dentiscutata erythropus TaxID=1348616 RepID=A0A9N9GRK0_9GLOM|nr:6804_t:CDS:1 [Dentiscutata erythropus]